MNNDFYKHIVRYLNSSINKKILILNDPYYSYSSINKNVFLNESIEKLQNKNDIQIIDTIEDFLELENNFEIIINIFFSATFINQLKFYNQVLKISVLETRFINILPFTGFINYGHINFNPIFFEYINKNENFLINKVSFLDKSGKRLEINEEYVSKIFFQTTEKRNQSFMDQLYNEIEKNLKDVAILFDLKINKLDLFNFDYLIPKRLGHHLSGHGNKTWIDKGAFNKLIEIIEVRTMIDVGCGTGGMVKYSQSFGINSIGVDGDNSIIRDIGNNFFLHDYTTGSFPTELNFDLCWCVEFLEHVDEKYLSNYFDTFKKCKFVFCTFAPKGKGGYHHVNLQTENYWIKKFEDSNFEYDKKNTEKIRQSSSIHRNFVNSYGLLFKNNKHL